MILPYNVFHEDIRPYTQMHIMKAMQLPCKPNLI
jgi:hypothetical protein